MNIYWIIKIIAINNSLFQNERIWPFALVTEFKHNIIIFLIAYMGHYYIFELCVNKDYSHPW